MTSALVNLIAKIANLFGKQLYKVPDEIGYRDPMDYVDAVYLGGMHQAPGGSKEEKDPWMKRFGG